ncbi:MAG: hypothetical protein ACRCYY_19445 [Trueperaceae bacterium]
MSAPTTTNTHLAKRLENLGLQGQATFSSQSAANLYDLFLQTNAKEFGADVVAEPNMLVEPQGGYAEHTKVTGATASFENTTDFWWLNDTTTRVSSSGGAWSFNTGGVPVDRRGVAIALLDGGFDPL